MDQNSLDIKISTTVQIDLFLERPKGYVKVLEKSTSSLSTMREVFEHYAEND
jgi:hypothetical protein